MIDVDKRIECVLDVLQHRANKLSIELEVEHTFDDELNNKSSVIVRNSSNDKFGIIAVNVENFLDEPICFFMFNHKLYKYCKMEGFELPDMLSGFKNKVFEKTDIKPFFEFILDDK